MKKVKCKALVRIVPTIDSVETISEKIGKGKEKVVSRRVIQHHVGTTETDLSVLDFAQRRIKFMVTRLGDKLKEQYLKEASKLAETKGIDNVEAKEVVHYGVETIKVDTAYEGKTLEFYKVYVDCPKENKQLIYTFSIE